MNDIESRLADAMAARAREVEPQDEDDALERISERVNMNRRRGLTVLGIAAALMVAVGAVALVRRDDDGQQVKVATDPTTTTTATTAPVPASVIPSGPTPIWPFASMNRTFTTPEEAARSFAVDYLGMTNARLGTTMGGDVEVFPNDRGTARTVVHVVDQAPGGWVVVGATADEITVDQPTADDTLTSPLTISGQSTAFEATIAVELRPYGSTNPVFKDIAMGGANGTIGPFTTSITPPATDQPLVLVLFESDASGEQTMIKASVIPLSAASAPEPTEFVAWTDSGDLVVLDFLGHQQGVLASGGPGEVAGSADLVAHTDASHPTCKPIYVDSGGRVTSAQGSRPALSPDGKLAYISCDGKVVVDEGAPGETAESVTWAGANVLITTADGKIDGKVIGKFATGRGRFGTVAFHDGTNISSYNPTTGAVVKLVQPPATPISLDADESGRLLLWVDVNHDLWKWSGGDPVKVGSGFTAAAW